MGWLFFHCFSNLVLNLECWPLVREEKEKDLKKTLPVKIRTKNKLNPLVVPCWKSKLGPAVGDEFFHYSTIPAFQMPCSPSSLCV